MECFLWCMWFLKTFLAFRSCPQYYVVFYLSALMYDIELKKIKKKLCNLKTAFLSNFSLQNRSWSSKVVSILPIKLKGYTVLFLFIIYIACLTGWVVYNFTQNCPWMVNNSMIIVSLEFLSKDNLDDVSILFSIMLNNLKVNAKVFVRLKQYRL